MKSKKDQATRRRRMGRPPVPLERARPNRVVTGPGCTPSRSAVLTGQLAIRTGTWEIGLPIEYTGLAAENVTMAEMLSQAGYATGFYGKLHLGDTEESYPHNQGFDEAFWALYNQVTSLYNKMGEGANTIIGMKEELLAENPYQRDRTFIQDEAFVFYLEGKKGELAREWRNGSQEPKDYRDFDIESRKRAPAYTGIANARPETIAISQPPAALKVLPYDVLEFIEQLDDLPYDATGDPGPGE